MENRSVPPVWVCLRLLQSKQKAPSIRVGTFRSMHGAWSLWVRRRNPASPLIEMRFAHGCRQQVLCVWRMQNPSFFARKGVFARETFAGFPPLFYKSRRRRAICSANRKCSKKKHHPRVAPDKKTLKKSVKSMFFMVQTRCEVKTIKYWQAQRALICKYQRPFPVPRHRQQLYGAFFIPAPAPIS